MPDVDVLTLIVGCAARLPAPRILREAGAVLLLVAVLAIAQSARAQVRYSIDAQIDAAASRLSAHAAIELSPHAIDAARRVRLDVGLGWSGAVQDSLRVDSLTTLQGARVPFEASDQQGILVAQLPPGDGASPALVVHYAIPLDSTDLEPFGYHLFFSVEPGTYWYPDVVNPDGTRDRFRDFEVALTFPDHLGVLTTGGLGARSQKGDQVQARYRAAHVEGFALAAGPGFRTEQYERNGVSIATFFHPDYAEEFGQVVERTAEAVAWYRSTYGFFPVPVLGILQGHPHWGGGFPLPNVFMVHLGHLDADFLAFITAHELGHYYWGLYVLGDQERLDWLVLANGIWADQLYLAGRSGRTLEAQWRHRGNGDWMLDYLTALAANHEQRLGITRQEEEAGLDFDYNSLIRHGKAATGLYLQARRVGAERFLRVQRQLLEEYRHRPLPVDAFVQDLEQAGAEGAADFFAAWRRGDARIGLVVERIEEDTAGAGYLVVLRRTGRVPYPVDVVMETGAGTDLRHTVPAMVKWDTLHVEARPHAVRLDPDGVVPMWNASHPGVRSLLVEALWRADLDQVFLPLARNHLADVPEDARVLYLVARRLYELGRWEEAVALGSEPGGCDSRDGCRAALYVARSLSRLGRSADAKTLLRALREEARSFGLDAAWQQAAAEIGEEGGE